MAERDVETTPPTDKESPDLYRILIIGLLIIVAIVCIVGGLLAWFEKPQADNLWAIGLAATVALAGMLAPRVAK